MDSDMTPVFLAETQQDQLSDLGKRQGRSLDELVHEAIDTYLAGETQAALDATFGAAPGLQLPLRGEWDEPS
jgi:hypothetical protein